MKCVCVGFSFICLPTTKRRREKTAHCPDGEGSPPSQPIQTEPEMHFFASEEKRKDERREGG